MTAGATPRPVEDLADGLRWRLDEHRALARMFESVFRLCEKALTPAGGELEDGADRVAGLWPGLVIVADQMGEDITQIESDVEALRKLARTGGAR